MHRRDAVVGALLRAGASPIIRHGGRMDLTAHGKELQALLCNPAKNVPLAYAVWVFQCMVRMRHSARRIHTAAQSILGVIEDSVQLGASGAVQEASEAAIKHAQQNLESVQTLVSTVAGDVQRLRQRTWDIADGPAHSRQQKELSAAREDLYTKMDEHALVKKQLDACQEDLRFLTQTTSVVKSVVFQTIKATKLENDGKVFAECAACHKSPVDCASGMNLWDGPCKHFLCDHCTWTALHTSCSLMNDSPKCPVCNGTWASASTLSPEESYLMSIASARPDGNAVTITAAEITPTILKARSKLRFQALSPDQIVSSHNMSVSERDTVTNEGGGGHSGEGVESDHMEENGRLHKGGKPKFEACPLIQLKRRYIGSSQSKRTQEWISAATKGDCLRMVCLLMAGVDVDVANEYGQTALFIACWSGHLDAVRLLLHAANSDPSICDNAGVSVYGIASFFQHADICALLDKCSSSSLTSLQQSTVSLKCTMMGTDSDALVDAAG